MCKCVEKFDEFLAQYNTSLVKLSMMNMKTGKLRETLQIATQKRERKPGKPKIVTPTYCPFCGKRSAPKPRARASVSSGNSDG